MPKNFSGQGGIFIVRIEVRRKINKIFTFQNFFVLLRLKFKGLNDLFYNTTL